MKRDWISLRNVTMPTRRDDLHQSNPYNILLETQFAASAEKAQSQIALP
jgi:hypothetical protein